MIVGIGVDIVDVERVNRMLDRYRDRFLKRVFTDAEIRYAQRNIKTAERLAGRFAVKEAVLKAFGTGKSQGILWKDVETVRGTMGKPEVILYGKALNYMKRLKGLGIFVSISHDGGKAIAFVIIERVGGNG
jgi:holo-[acyl-carrier protein] synthase